MRPPSLCSEPNLGDALPGPVPGGTGEKDRAEHRPPPVFLPKAPALSLGSPRIWCSGKQVVSGR